MNGKLLKTLFIAAAGVILLTGCGKKEDKYEGYLKTFTEGSVVTIDPIMFADNASDCIISNTQAVLFRRKSDGSLLPDLAESYEVSEDGLTYTFHLRDTSWSNGEAVTANDFVYGMQQYLAQNGAMPGVYIEMAHIKNADKIYYGDENGNHLDISELGVKAVDEKTLVITLEKPVDYLPSILSMRSFSPLNQKFFEAQEEGMYATGPDTILCSGAFVVEDYIPGTSSVLVKKNPYYWDADNVTLPGIEFFNIDDADTNIAAFKVGALESVRVSSSSHSYCENDPELAPYLKDYNLGSFSYLVFNIDSENGSNISQNTNLRLAISNAINRESICSNLMNDAAKPCYSPIPQATFFNKETGEDFISDSQKYKEYCDYDVERAKVYLEEAKKELGQDKIEIDFMVTTNGSKLAQVIKEQLEKNLEGVTVNLEIVQFGEFLERLNNGNYQLSLHAYLPDFMDPMALMLLYADGAELNKSGYHNDEFMKLYQMCETGEYSMDYDKRWNAMRESLDIVIKEQPIVPLYIGCRSLLLRDRLKGADYLVGGTIIYQDAHVEE